MDTPTTTALLPVQVEGEILRIDSTHFAEGLGIQHKNLLESIRTHQSAIEEGFGLIAFQTRKSENSTAKGRPETVAHLSEDQALFIATLSRNSPQVVQFKKRLVQSFAAARRRLSAEVVAGPDLENLFLQHVRLMDTQHREQVRVLSREISQIKASLNPFQRGNGYLPEPTLNDSDLKRAIIRTIDNYCTTRGYSLEDTWHYAYKRLLVQNGIDVRKLYRMAGSNDLDALEKHGLLDKLWAIVSIDLK